MATTELTGIWRVVDKLQSAGGVAAVLATMIAGTICVRYLLYREAGDLPPVLSHSLSVILGFYFGSKTVASKNGL
jgi:hypothetical protein